MRKTARTYESAAPDANFIETTTGDAPCSIEVSINAKGEAQISVKLYLADADALAESGPERIAALVARTEMRLRDEGYPLAGHAAKGGN